MAFSKSFADSFPRGLSCFGTKAPGLSLVDCGLWSVGVPPGDAERAPSKGEQVVTLLLQHDGELVHAEDQTSLLMCSRSLAREVISRGPHRVLDLSVLHAVICRVLTKHSEEVRVKIPRFIRRAIHAKDVAGLAFRASCIREKAGFVDGEMGGSWFGTRNFSQRRTKGTAHEFPMRGAIQFTQAHAVQFDMPRWYGYVAELRDSAVMDRLQARNFLKTHSCSARAPPSSLDSIGLLIIAAVYGQFAVVEELCILSTVKLGGVPRRKTLHLAVFEKLFAAMLLHDNRRSHAVRYFGLAALNSLHVANAAGYCADTAEKMQMLQGRHVDCASPEVLRRILSSALAQGNAYAAEVAVRALTKRKLRLQGGGCLFLDTHVLCFQSASLMKALVRRARVNVLYHHNLFYGDVAVPIGKRPITVRRRPDQRHIPLRLAAATLNSRSIARTMSNVILDRRDRSAAPTTTIADIFHDHTEVDDITSFPRPGEANFVLSANSLSSSNTGGPHRRVVLEIAVPMIPALARSLSFCDFLYLMKEVEYHIRYLCSQRMTRSSTVVLANKAYNAMLCVLEDSPLRSQDLAEVKHHSLSVLCLLLSSMLQHALLVPSQTCAVSPSRVVRQMSRFFSCSASWNINETVTGILLAYLQKDHRCFTSFDESAFPLTAPRIRSLDALFRDGYKHTVPFLDELVHILDSKGASLFSARSLQRTLEPTVPCCTAIFMAQPSLLEQFCTARTMTQMHSGFRSQLVHRKGRLSSFLSAGEWYCRGAYIEDAISRCIALLVTLTETGYTTFGSAPSQAACAIISSFPAETDTTHFIAILNTLCIQARRDFIAEEFGSAEIHTLALVVDLLYITRNVLRTTGNVLRTTGKPCFGHLSLASEALLEECFRCMLLPSDGSDIGGRSLDQALLQRKGRRLARDRTRRYGDLKAMLCDEQFDHDHSFQWHPLAPDMSDASAARILELALHRDRLPRVRYAPVSHCIQVQYKPATEGRVIHRVNDNHLRAVVARFGPDRAFCELMDAPCTCSRSSLVTGFADICPWWDRTSFCKGNVHSLGAYLVLIQGKPMPSMHMRRNVEVLACPARTTLGTSAAALVTIDRYTCDRSPHLLHPQFSRKCTDPYRTTYSTEPDSSLGGGNGVDPMSRVRILSDPDADSEAEGTPRTAVPSTEPEAAATSTGESPVLKLPLVQCKYVRVQWRNLVISSQQHVAEENSRKRSRKRESEDTCKRRKG